MAGLECSRRLASLWLLLASIAMALPAAAQAPEKPRREPVRFEVTVLHVLEKGGQIEPRAQRFHAIIGRKIRYEGLRIVQSGSRVLGLNEIGSIELPTGKSFRFRPLSVGETGVLVAVDLESSAQGDFRIPKGKPVIIGGYPYEGGQLMVVLEPAS